MEIRNGKLTATGKYETLEADALIMALGQDTDTSFVRKLDGIQFKNDGTVEDSHYSTIGHIKSDGTVEDSHYSTIGHASGIKKEWAAAYFFFFKLN